MVGSIEETQGAPVKPTMQLRDISIYTLALSREHVKRAEVKLSAPVEPTAIGVITSTEGDEVQRLCDWSSVTGLTDA